MKFGDTQAIRGRTDILTRVASMKMSGISKTIMAMETDKKSLPWIRIISGLAIIFIGGIGFGVYAGFGIYELTQIRFEKLWLFEYLWGKLLILFISGLIFLTYLSIIGIITIIGLTILQGKKRLMEHIIHPFPTVLTNEIVRDMKIERADDEFLIFDLGFLIRKTLIIVGGIPALAFAWSIYVDIDNPYSEIYFPPVPGMTIAFFVMFLYGVFPPSRRFVLDRMKGTITFPRHLFFRRCTIPFSKVVPGYSVGTLGFAHPYTGIVLSVIGQYDSGWWSFYVLYMDKNRPLPQGSAFDPYREKDFLRRKAEGFPKPIYPNTILVTDAYMGYIYGTDEFKQRLSKMKHRIVYYYDRVSWYCQDHEIEIPNDNDLVLIGLWKKQFVFKLFAPENVEYIIIPDDTVLADCFLCNSDTAEVKYIK